MQATYVKRAIAEGSELLALLRSHVRSYLSKSLFILETTHYGTLRIRPGKLDSLFLISNFGAGGRSFITCTRAPGARIARYGKLTGS